MTWKRVEEAPDYEVSDAGVVRNTSTGKMLTPWRNKHGGYLTVRLYRDRKQLDRLVHRLVAAAFIPCTEREIHHIDGDKTNNKVSNLRWVSRSENMRLAHADGLAQVARGEKSNLSKLTTRQVLAIRTAAARGVVQVLIAARYGITQAAVSAIVTRRNWRHL